MSSEPTIRTAFDRGDFRLAFEAMAEAYASVFFRTALRIVLDHDAANDVVQEASIKMWQKLPLFRGDSMFKTWGYRIVVNEALTHLRKNRRYVSGDFSDLIAPSSHLYNGDDILEELYRAMATLPDKQRITFQLRYFDDNAYADIAATLNRSEGACKANYHHVVNKIKKHFNELNLTGPFASIL